MSEYAGVELPYKREDLGREIVTTPDGVQVQVITIWETGPHDMVPGGCSCHLKGAIAGTALSWPAGHRTIELAEYTTVPEAHKGHREIAEAVKDGRLSLTPSGMCLQVSAACGHEEQAGLPRISSSVHFRRLYAALFGNCKSCLAGAVPSEGCAR